MKHFPILKHLDDELKLLIKPVEPKDLNCLLSGFHQLSPRSKYMRFMRPLKTLSNQELTYLTNIDHINHEAIAAGLLKNHQLTGIGVARYIRLTDNPTKAEMAVTIVDQYQHQGIGILLVECLAERAYINGISQFIGYFLSNNQPAEKWLKKLGGKIKWEGGPVLKAEMDIENILKITKNYRYHNKLAVG